MTPKSKNARRHEGAGTSDRGGIPPEVVSCFNALVQGVELLGVQLVESHAKIDPSKMAEAAEGELALRVESPAHTAAFVEEGQRVLYCGTRFRLVLGPNGDSEDEVVAVFAEYSLLYRVPEELECTEEAARLFASRNGVFNAWPFFRELAHSLVSRMGLPPLVLPLYRLPVKPPK